MSEGSPRNSPRKFHEAQRAGTNVLFFSQTRAVIRPLCSICCSPRAPVRMQSWVPKPESVGLAAIKVKVREHGNLCVSWTEMKGFSQLWWLFISHTLKFWKLCKKSAVSLGNLVHSLVIFPTCSRPFSSVLCWHLLP